MLISILKRKEVEMKRLLLVIIIALVLTVATGIPALAVDLELPNGKVIEDLPDQAEKATKSGKVTIDRTCPICGGYPCIPPCPGV